MDFDKLFETYLMRWYDEHKDDYETPDDLESEMPVLYDRWADAPADELNGVSPRAYFAAIDDPARLADMLAAGDPCALLVDRIAEAPGMEGPLAALLNGPDPAVVMTAMNLLNDRGYYPFDVYAGWLAGGGADDEQLELAVEIMAEHADIAADLLFPLIDGADLTLKTLLAEILVNAKKDERTYKLLSELFLSGGNVPLYAGYLGKYGDERAAGMLYRALDDCNYLEYLEIKNAIERMGGVVEDSRDFTDDEYYKAIKHLK